MPPYAYAWSVAQLLPAAIVGLTLIMMVRRITRWSPLAGRIVTVGLLLRVALGLALFWVSFLQLPIAHDLQLGDGFWSWALDARDYYLRAVGPLTPGWIAGSERGPSPLFVRTLGWWLGLIGVTPASAILLNGVCYVLLCAAIVWMFSASREGGPGAAIVPVAALTFSPALLLFTTQPLKDVFFVALVGMLCVAAAASSIPDESRIPNPESRIRRLFWFALFLLAAYAIADVRWYYALLVFGSACVAALVAVVDHTGFRQPAKLAARIVVSVVALRLLWIAVMLGNGYYYPSLRAAALGHPMQGTNPVSNIGTIVDAMTRIPEDRAISLTPKWQGTMNIAVPDTPSSQPADIPPVKAAMMGLGALFVPLSVLRALSIVDVKVGGAVGLLMDLDTLFLDATLVAVALLLVRGRDRLRARLPFLTFTTALAVSTTVLMAYVVTNYGAMLRLRSLVAVPFWMLPLALAASPVGGRLPVSQEPSAFAEASMDRQSPARRRSAGR